MQCNICSKQGGPGTLFACSSCGYIICADPACSTNDGDKYICARCRPTGKIAKKVYKDKEGKSKTIQEITGGAEATKKETPVKQAVVEPKPVDDLSSLAALCADPEKLEAAIKKTGEEIEGKKRFLKLLKAAAKSGGENER